MNPKRTAAAGCATATLLGVGSLLAIPLLVIAAQAPQPTQCYAAAVGSPAEAAAPDAPTTLPSESPPTVTADASDQGAHAAADGSRPIVDAAHVGGAPPTSTIHGPPCVTAEEAWTSGRYALPVPRIWYDRHPEWFTKPHHDYPAADIPVPTGTPVYAVTTGTVITAVHRGSCGVTVIIAGDDGATYTYCHGQPSSHEVAAGDRVAAGQLLMLSGSTGRSTGPHLHFAVAIGAMRRCPQPLLVSAAKVEAISVAFLPASGCIQ